MSADFAPARRRPVRLLAVVGLNLAGSLAIQLLVIRLAGIGVQTDVYIASQTLPAVWTAIVLACVQGVWLHRFSATESDQAEKRAALSVALAQSTCMALLSCCLFALTARAWFDFVFPGLPKHAGASALLLNDLNWLGAAINIAAFPLLLRLRSAGQFLRSETWTLVATVITVCGIYLFLPRFGIEAAALAFVLRSGFTAVSYYVLLGRPRIRMPVAKSMATGRADFANLFAGNSVYKTMPVVDRFFASQASSGSITALNLASTAIGAAGNLLDRAFCAPVIAAFGALIQAGRPDLLRLAYRRALARLWLWVAPLLVIIWLLRAELGLLVVRAFRASPEVGAEVVLIGLLLVASLYAAAAGTILVAGFYALGDSRTPTVVGMAGFIIGVASKATLFPHLGLEGIAAATSFYLALNAVMFFLLLERKIAAKTNP